MIPAPPGPSNSLFSDLRALCALCVLCVKSLSLLLPVNCRLSTSSLDRTMKTKKPNAAQIWKQLEDHLVPRLRLSITDRAIYSHLLRHSRLEGRTRLRFSIAWLARGARLSTNPARWAVRRLIAHGALRLLERSKAGHLVDVRLPDEIRATRHKMIRRRDARPLPRCLDFEQDFLKTRALRHAIERRRDKGDAIGDAFYETK